MKMSTYVPALLLTTFIVAGCSDDDDDDDGGDDECPGHICLPDAGADDPIARTLAFQDITMPMGIEDPADFPEMPNAAATLTRYVDKIELTLNVTEFTTASGQFGLPGHVVSVWWAFFNEDHNCVSWDTDQGQIQCGPQDFSGDPGAAVKTAFGYAVPGPSGGEIVQADGSWSVSMRTYNEGQNDGMLLGPGLIDARHAEIHVVLQDHGPAKEGAELEVQRTMNNGGCQDRPDMKCVNFGGASFPAVEF